MTEQKTVYVAECWDTERHSLLECTVHDSLEGAQFDLLMCVTTLSEQECRDMEWSSYDQEPEFSPRENWWRVFIKDPEVFDYHSPEQIEIREKNGIDHVPRKISCIVTERHVHTGSRKE